MNDLTQQASDILYGHWMGGTRLDALPEALRPQTRAEGYAVQALLEPRSAARANNRLATLAQAIRSTRPTTINNP